MSRIGHKLKNLLRPEHCDFKTQCFCRSRFLFRKTRFVLAKSGWLLRGSHRLPLVSQGGTDIRCTPRYFRSDHQKRREKLHAKSSRLGVKFHSHVHVQFTIAFPLVSQEWPEQLVSLTKLAAERKRSRATSIVRLQNYVTPKTTLLVDPMDTGLRNRGQIIGLFSKQAIDNNWAARGQHGHYRKLFSDNYR